jgi:hypothetical protein
VLQYSVCYPSQSYIAFLDSKTAADEDRGVLQKTGFKLNLTQLTADNIIMNLLTVKASALNRSLICAAVKVLNLIKSIFK